MPGAVARLVAQYRARQRPRWSQQFLADELSRHGLDVQRHHVARLEQSAPNAHHAGLLAAAAAALRIPAPLVIEALARDFAVALQDVADRLVELSSEDERVVPRPLIDEVEAICHTLHASGAGTGREGDPA